MTGDEIEPTAGAGDTETPGAVAHRGEVDPVAFLESVLGENLYRDNPFRLTGLPADADPALVAQRAAELERGETRTALPGCAIVLPVEPAPDAGALRVALDHLREPAHRLVFELFWFTPAHGADSARDALVRNNVGRAQRIWLKRMAEDATAAHDAAVLCHLRLLDTSDGGSAGDWETAFLAWGIALYQDDTWDRLRARAARIDERLSCGSAVDDLRRALPAALLRINAELMTRAVLDGSSVTGAPHVRVIELLEKVEKPFADAPFTSAAALDEAREWAARTLSERLCSIAEKTRLLAADRPAEACAAAQDMLDRATAPLRVIDRLCPPPSRLGAEARDAIVDTGLFCSARHYDTAADLVANHALLGKLWPFATASSWPRIVTQRDELVVRDVESLCAGAMRTLDADRGSGADVGRALLDLTSVALKWSLAADQSDGPVTAELCAMIAEAATASAVAERERSGDLFAAEQLLDALSILARGTEAEDLVHREFGVLVRAIQQRETELSARCWFCGDGLALHRPYRVVLYGSHPFTGVRRTHTARVPRCFDCGWAQRPGDRKRGFLLWAGLFGRLGATVAFGVSIWGHPAYVVCAIFVALTIMSLLIRRRIAPDVEARARQHPFVTDMQRQGWQLAWW
ncbi:hypothetical protein AB0L57_30645 [Nocardia sp. NPDC052254]|uniref:hypothetical protein n=1 Tax=Nocardia sp. NPDC052254 TaxID=3155681 RepID=UPI0034377055